MCCPWIESHGKCSNWRGAKTSVVPQDVSRYLCSVGRLGQQEQAEPDPVGIPARSYFAFASLLGYDGQVGWRRSRGVLGGCGPPPPPLQSILSLLRLIFALIRHSDPSKKSCAHFSTGKDICPRIGKVPAFKSRTYVTPEERKGGARQEETHTVQHVS
jgi:hypothetical protein